MSSINENTEAVNQILARDEALGPVDGPCCAPEISPCLSCLPDDEASERFAWTREHEARILEGRIADDVAIDPSDADLAWYTRWLAEHDGDIAPGRSFTQKIADICNLFRDSEDEAVRFVGEHVARLYDTAVFLGATGPENFADKYSAMLDAAHDAATARAGR